ncbi:hypothetical protein GCM10027295_31820 [Pseudaeromonas pectinilytica]
MGFGEMENGLSVRPKNVLYIVTLPARSNTDNPVSPSPRLDRKAVCCSYE